MKTNSCIIYGNCCNECLVGCRLKLSLATLGTNGMAMLGGADQKSPYVVSKRVCKSDVLDSAQRLISVNFLDL